jgi:hypothetical protein
VYKNYVAKREKKGGQAPTMKKMLVELPVELIKRLKVTAVQNDRQMKEMVKEALTAYLDNLEKGGSRKA